MKFVAKSLNYESAARGFAAISRAALEDTSFTENDVVRVTANSGASVLAVVVASSMDEGGHLPVVGVDIYLRDLLDIEFGERVTVDPAPVAHADSVTVRIPRAVNLDLANEPADLIKPRLEGRPLTLGRPAAVALPVDGTDGELHIPIRPTDLFPEGPVVVSEETEVDVEYDVPLWKTRSVHGDADVSFADIGGLDQEITQVRELIELPLERAALFERLGIDAPTGVLLHGPAGTGKSLLAKAIATELETHFVHLRGPELVGRAAQNDRDGLEDAFDEARAHAPSVVFIDELDAIGGQRSSGHSSRGATSTLGQLLTHLDQLDAADQVVVMAATNDLGSLAESLRQAERFDREVEVGVPDTRDRQEILEIHTQDVPLAPAVDLAEFAARSHGYVGADLETLVREAGINAAQRIDLTYDLAQDDISIADLTPDDLLLTTDDFDQALTQVEPTAMREITVEVPTVGWDDVGGLSTVKQRLREALEWPLAHGTTYRQLDIEPAAGVLLYGPPGTGKTLIARAVANEAACNFISIKGPELMNMWVGESERNVRELFEKARTHAPCVLFFDEIDAIGAQRGSDAGSSGVTDRVVSQLLTELDGIDPLENVSVVAATNRRNLIDDALLRPGRLDYQLEVGLPDADARREILRIHTASKPLADGVDLEALVHETGERSGAELEALCREAALEALRTGLADGSYQFDRESEPPRIEPIHFEIALETITSS